MKGSLVFAMVALLGVAVWLVLGGERDGELAAPPDGVAGVDLRVGTLRGRLEHTAADDTFRLRFPGDAGEVLTRGQVRRVFGADTLEQLFEAPPNWLFQLFNISSWGSLAWIAIGLLGQTAFFLRMFVQWVASERRRESIVPESFWWLSFAGGVALFSYFVWRRDLIGALGQTTGIVVYARNLRLIHKRRRADLRSAGG